MHQLDGARVVAVVLAAGAGERMGAGVPKAFRELGGHTLLALSAGAAAATPDVDALVVVCPAGMQEQAAAQAGGLGKQTAIIGGGASRHASVRAALAEVPDSAAVVLCHDAARALARPALFSAVVQELSSAPQEIAAVVPVVPVADTIKRVVRDEVLETVPRADLRAAQTPQGFRAGDLARAHDRAHSEGFEFTDDAAVIEWAGGRVRVIDGDANNLKITTERDLVIASQLLTRAQHE